MFANGYKLGEAKSQGKIAEHTEISAAAAKQFLGEFELDDEVVKKILNCIEAHHGKIEYICPEAEICANADCYRFILPKNVFIFIAEQVKGGKSYEEAIKFASEKLEEKHNVLSLDICKQELEEYYQAFKKLFSDALS